MERKPSPSFSSSAPSSPFSPSSSTAALIADRERAHTSRTPSPPKGPQSQRRPSAVAAKVLADGAKRSPPARPVRPPTLRVISPSSKLGGTEEKPSTLRNPQGTIPTQPAKKKLEVKVDALVDGTRAKVTLELDSSTTVKETLDNVIKRFPDQREVKFSLSIPPCPMYKNGLLMEETKKLADFDEKLFQDGPPLEMKQKAVHKVNAPTPKTFFSDPNARVTVSPLEPRTGSSRSGLRLDFEFMSESDFSKPDAEGELLKQGTSYLRSWKQRYFILQGRRLFRFKAKPKEIEEPNATFNLTDGTIEKSSSKTSKPFSMELNVFHENSQKRMQLYLAASTADEYSRWLHAFERAMHGEELKKNSQVISQNVSIFFSPAEGYVGLSDEWKKLLSDCGVTERHFYEQPEQTLQLLKFFSTRAEPIVNHAPHKSIAQQGIDDVVTINSSPQELYEDFVLIGSGTFGEVYRALNRRSQQKVAVKKMLLTPKREPLFLSEIKVQRSTEHPNVVKLFEAYKVDDHIWVVLEYMEGGNLYQILSALEEGKLTLGEPQVAYIILETLKALSYIHGMHRIHRDIKSDNILIGANAEVKLADFGYAVQLSQQEEKRTTMAGSPYWMAPEIIEGNQYGKEVDIWSLGVLLIECCDLQPPYITEAPSKALVLITTQPPPPLQKPDRWSKELKHFLSLCMQKSPGKRPESIELLQHPMLRVTGTAKEFKETVLSKSKKNAKPCTIQ